jgi:hypothetical protein
MPFKEIIDVYTDKHKKNALSLIIIAGGTYIYHKALKR